MFIPMVEWAIFCWPEQLHTAPRYAVADTPGKRERAKGGEDINKERGRKDQWREREGGGDKEGRRRRGRIG